MWLLTCVLSCFIIIFVYPLSVSPHPYSTLPRHFPPQVTPISNLICTLPLLVLLIEYHMFVSI